MRDLAVLFLHLLAAVVASMPSLRLTNAMPRAPSSSSVVIKSFMFRPRRSRR